ncbi:hypothetical protein, partial [Nocardia sp. JMUB6875]|uniref:hypothetical protein n=1 Tax=Nocardia sp. JMUB6875 TaxID=3158170 RepID=UPI0034E8CB1B
AHQQAGADRSEGEPAGRSPLGDGGAQRLRRYVRGKLPRPRWTGRMQGAGDAARAIVVAMLWARYSRRCANSSKR